MDNKIKHIHFIGIGGAGMTPLALHCCKLGYEVSGSDLRSHPFTQLHSAGITPVIGHGKLAEQTDLVIYSAAVNDDNCELRQARQKNIPSMKRAEFLGLLTKDAHAILIAGSHGKSTSSVMLADVMYNHPGFRASALVGAESLSNGSNYYDGETDYLIVEADEYDKSFLKMDPADLIILNIDDDHLDIYGDLEGVISAFRELGEKLPEEGVLVYNGDDANVKRAVASLSCRKVSCGRGRKNRYRAEHIRFENFTTTFDLWQDNSLLGPISFQGSGIHYLDNLLAVLAMALEKGVAVADFRQLIRHFKGLKRRQEVIYQDEHFYLIDDYAHHSTEIKRSLESIRENCSGRMVVMFQPHLFSRTRHQYQEFARSFACADIVLISQIYPAREAFDPAISSSMILQAMSEESSKKTEVFADFDTLYKALQREVKEGDVVVSLGAGEINELLYRYRDEVICGS